MAEPEVSADAVPAVCSSCGARLTNGLAGNCPACLAALALGMVGGGESESGPPAPAERSSKVPRRLGAYELLGEIARGGFGVVYRARQPGLNRQVALKVLLGGEFASPEARRRFFLEAEAVARLQHPGIVTIHEVGEHDGLPFFAMELVEGRSLAEEVARQPLVPRLAARLLQHVSEAVHYAHSRGVIHRDLKPSNILLDGWGRPRVTDFGLARRVESQTQLTRSDEMLGSPSYLPPERLRRSEPGTTSSGEPASDSASGSGPDGASPVLPLPQPSGNEPASDIYSLGATLYHLVTGRPPFVGDSVHAVLAQVEHDDAVAPRRLNPTVPRDLETICLRCLEKEPGRRYGTAAELAADLGRFLADEPIHARPLGWVELGWRWCRRQPVVASLVALLTTSLLGGSLGATALWRRAEHARERSGLEAYAADLRLASQAINEGDLGRARRLLEPHRAAEPDFAWRLLWHRCRGDHVSVVGAHSWIVSDVAWSPDGHALLSGGIGSGTVRGETKLWDLRTSPPTAIRLSGAARQVVWPAGGGRFLTANQDGIVRVWDAATRTVVREFPGRTVAASSAGTRVVLGEASPFWWEEATPVPARLWLADRDEFRVLPPANHVAVSPDGEWAALADWQGNLSLCSLPDGAVRHALPGAGKPWALVFSPDNRWLVVTGVQPDARVYDLHSPSNPPVRLAGHSLSTWSAGFSPDGRVLVTTSSDRTLRFWRVGTWESPGQLRGHGDETWCVSFRPDGRQLASGGKDHQILLWQPPSLVPQPEFLVGPYERPHLSSDGRRLGSHPGGTNWVTDLARGTRNSGGPGTLVGFTPDARSTWSWRGGFQLAQIPLEADAGPGNGPNRTVVTLTLAHDDNESPPEYVITGARGTLAAGWHPIRGVSVWSLPQGRRVCRQELPDFRPHHFAFDPAGHRLAAVGGEAGGRLLDLRDGTVRPLTNHLDQMKDAAFSSDGRLLATASVDSTIKLWDPVYGRELATLRGHLTQVDSVAFAGDGTTLASVEERLGIRLWHLPTRRELAVLPLSSSGGWLAVVPGDTALVVRREGGNLDLIPAPAPASPVIR